MSKYYVNINSQPNGDHEVHTEWCSRLPLPHNRQYLGDLSSCEPAVKLARKVYPTADGCFYCCRPCHKS